jgi:son of sevenless-like protein
MTDTKTDNTNTLRPFSTSSIISPHAALEALTKDMYPDIEGLGLTEEQEETTSSSASSSRHTSTRDQSPSHSPAQAHVNATTATAAEMSPTSPKYIVRAQFDFDASDPSALSFKSGDVIEVFTMLESGWWDGMLDGRRGWFPSNFVEELQLDDEEERPLSHHDHEHEHEHEHEHTHGLGSVGDEMDRERDMALLDTEEFGVPSRHRHRRDISQSSSLGMEEVGWGSGGLDDLAREMMDSNLQEEGEDEGKAFQAEAMRRRRLRDSDDVDDFGTLKTPYSRRREETDDTVRQHRNGGTAGGRDRGKARESVLQDAWIPSLTPEGQVRMLFLCHELI